MSTTVVVSWSLRVGRIKSRAVRSEMEVRGGRRMLRLAKVRPGGEEPSGRVEEGGEGETECTEYFSGRVQQREEGG